MLSFRLNYRMCLAWAGPSGRVYPSRLAFHLAGQCWVLLYIVYLIYRAAFALINTHSRTGPISRISNQALPPSRRVRDALYRHFSIQPNTYRVN